MKKSFIVYDRTTGGEYLTESTTKAYGFGRKYRWAKISRKAAARLTKEAARKAASRYGGLAVQA
jgi:hypothetical protein